MPLHQATSILTQRELVFAMGGQDPEQMFNDFDKETMEDMPANAEVNPVNTDLEVGAEFTLHIDPKTTDETEKSFLPTVAGKKCFMYNDPQFLEGRQPL